MSVYDTKIFLPFFGPLISAIDNSELKKCISQKNSWILVGEKLLFSLQKYPRDWERVKDHTKAYDVM